ncbi:hypothetical protein BaRGS_00013636 [Batillaria attramentaria]|uniref:Uncharacterized protein n=1 Tax=Batillaria attramentaria TaxID=370345 RepID=A0ABD0L658_9CAEN|nr:hypothetical protein BaRGS_010712 [Batillaria attramentaria]
MDKAHAYNETDSKSYYLTPAAFFSGGERDRDPADTAKGVAGVLDRQGNLRAVKASGMRITLPNIPDVGVMRTRYPIAPVFSEGSPIWKELEALRDIVLDMKSYAKYLKSQPVMAEPPTAAPAHHDATDNSEKTDVQLEAPSTLVTSPSHPEPVGMHTHTIDLAEWEWELLTEGNEVLRALTSEDNGHSHSLQIRFDKDTGKIRIVGCDKKAECKDGHSAVLEREEDNIHAV